MSEKTGKRKSGRHYPQETRDACVADMLAGMKTKDAAERHGVTVSAATYWRGQDTKKGTTAARSAPAGHAKVGGRLLYSMAKSLKVRAMQRIRDGGDAGDLETEALSFANFIMSGSEQ
jgi:transposase-like protein